MEHVDSDMDDLFRKAGELYPLKTTDSDWEGVLGKLREEISGESGGQPDLQARRNRNKTRWLLLILLIPLGLFSLVYFSGSVIKQKPGPSAGAVKSQGNSSSAVQENNPASIDNQAIPSADKTATAKPETASGIATNRPVSPAENSSADRFAQAENRSGTTGTHTNKDVKLTNTTPSVSERKKPEYHNTLSSTDAESFHEPVKKAVPLSVSSPNEYPSVYGMPFPPTPVVSIIWPNEGKGGSVSLPKSGKSGSPKGLYAVLLGGPDMSTVAFQSTTQTGYSLGILLGYRFNKHLSMETGIMLDKKYYYSNGEYFDKSKIPGFPPGEKILSVDGNCYMFEIPLDLRYNFATRNNHSFFMTVGLSSYLMKKEYYTYSAVGSGYNPPWTGHEAYMNATNNILSILQISAGYEHKIGSNTNIRIEPYLKLPLQGIGISNMPISSAGLYIGISHSFR